MLLPIPMQQGVGSALHNHDQNRLRIKAKYRPEELTISLCGDADGAALLGRLQALISLAHSHRHLALDLSLVEDLDHLSLSALLVALRHQDNKFPLITFSGLPVWATQRLMITDPEDLLGYRWKVSIGPGTALFSHCELASVLPKQHGVGYATGEA